MSHGKHVVTLIKPGKLPKSDSKSKIKNVAVGGSAKRKLQTEAKCAGALNALYDNAPLKAPSISLPVFSLDIYLSVTPETALLEKMAKEYRRRVINKNLNSHVCPELNNVPMRLSSFRRLRDPVTAAKTKLDDNEFWLDDEVCFTFYLFNVVYILLTQLYIFINRLLVIMQAC
jgi:hypothetical protein